MGAKVDKSFEFSIKTSNATEYIELDVQNIEAPKKIILSSIMYEKTYLQGSLEGVLEAIQVSSL